MEEKSTSGAEAIHFFVYFQDDLVLKWSKTIKSVPLNSSIDLYNIISISVSVKIILFSNHINNKNLVTLIGRWV